MIELPEGDVQEMIAALAASRREMTGTAKLLGSQHTAIAALSDALRRVLTARTDCIENDARDTAWSVLEQWGMPESVRPSSPPLPYGDPPRRPHDRTW